MVDGTKNDQKENKKARWRFKYINIKGKMTKKHNNSRKQKLKRK